MIVAKRWSTRAVRPRASILMSGPLPCRPSIRASATVPCSRRTASPLDCWMSRPRDHMPKPPIRIAMWSGPRNISTAMMRAWENRADTTVVDEPLYAAYLDHTGLDHPGATEIINAYDTDWRDVADMLLGPIPGDKPIWYQKQMAHHLLPDMQIDWVDGLTNCFLIRSPREVITSYIKIRPDPTQADLGFVQQLDIFEQVQAANRQHSARSGRPRCAGRSTQAADVVVRSRGRALQRGHAALAGRQARDRRRLGASLVRRRRTVDQVPSRTWPRTTRCRSICVRCWINARASMMCCTRIGWGVVEE